MEQGTLPSAGVSQRVLEALGRVVGVTAAQLREAGRAVGGAALPPAAASFARVGSPDPQYVDAEALMAGRAPAEPRDEIDELFTGASGD
jgi:hypothetical protein